MNTNKEINVEIERYPWPVAPNTRQLGKIQLETLICDYSTEVIALKNDAKAPQGLKFHGRKISVSKISILN